ncbi:hypothetical protein BH11BAC5_BH11BAC5_41060 [soil metagenome]
MSRIFQLVTQDCITSLTNKIKYKSAATAQFFKWLSFAAVIIVRIKKSRLTPALFFCITKTNCAFIEGKSQPVMKSLLSLPKFRSRLIVPYPLIR